MSRNMHVSVGDLLSGLLPNESMTFYVMPKVNIKDKDETFYVNETVVTYLNKGVVNFAEVTGNSLGNPLDLRPGQKIIMYGTERGDIFSKYVPRWEYAAEFNGTKYCLGQSVLVSAPPGGGKTTATASLADSYERHPLSVGYRLLIGERMDDKLYGKGQIDKTIHCDSSAPMEVQLRTVYVTLTNALVDAYEGKHSILAIDSLTRFMSSLTGLHSDSHMESGGVSHDVKVMVSNLFRLAGGYGKGTLTIIGTCFYSPANNTWKNIYTELSAAANGEITTARSSKGKSLIGSSTRRKEIIEYPYFTVFGMKVYY